MQKINKNNGNLMKKKRNNSLKLDKRTDFNSNKDILSNLS